MATHKHIGSDFEDFLREEGILEEVDARVQKRIIAEQLRHAMDAASLSESALARRMATSRTVVRSLLDPENESATLSTLVKAASAVGRHLTVSLDIPGVRTRRPAMSRRTRLSRGKAQPKGSRRSSRR